MTLSGDADELDRRERDTPLVPPRRLGSRPGTEPSPPAGQLKLVLVDDDPVERLLMKRALEARGHVCTAFADVRAAIAHILDEPPSVIVTDLRMPGLGGKDLCDVVQRTLGMHAPPIVVVSGVDDVEPIRDVLDAGAVHFVGKPFRASELVAVVERAACGPLPRLSGSASSEKLERLGGYEILEILGRGGMSSVYRASSPEGLEVVLKVQNPEVGQLDQHLRFHREFQLLASLAHPGLPRVTACASDRGRNYIVMELVRGQALDVRLRLSGPMPPREVASLALQLARTLDHVHAQGVVHRDVKPSNVILRTDGPPCLIDFGVARHGQDHSVTSRFEIVGTPSYCAPELAGSDAISPKVDTFALGVTLYEAIVGEHPLFWQLEYVPPVDLLLFYGREGLPDVRKYVPSVPAPLAELMRRMVAPDPEARPTAAQAARELEAILAASG